MAIPSSTYTELVTTTLDNYRSELADNVTNHNPLLAKLKRRGNTTNVGGGAKILENLMYADNSTVKWYSGLEQLDVGASDVLTSANFDWKELNANVIISGLEKAQNSGTKESVFNLVKSRIQVAEISLMNEVSLALFYSNTEKGGKAIGGLQHLVADLPTTGTVGGINRANDSWWRNQFYDFSTESVPASKTTIQHAMNTVYINATRGRDMIDMFVGDSVYFSYYLESLQDSQRFMSDNEASAGFRAIKFWGGHADVFFDPAAPATSLYGLNTKYLGLRAHTDFNFVTLDEKASTNQDATLVPIYWKGNLCLSNGSLQAVICD